LASPVAEPRFPTRIVLPFVLVPDSVEATSEEHAEIVAAMWEIELAGADVFEPNSFIAASPLGRLSSGVSERVVTSLTVSDDSQVEIPIGTVMCGPKSHVLRVIEWEVKPDVVPAVEPALALLLLLNPVLKALNHHLHMEFRHVVISWLWHMVDHGVHVSGLVSLNKARVEL